jgi:hypothetical protein
VTPIASSGAMFAGGAQSVRRSSRPQGLLDPSSSLIALPVRAHHIEIHRIGAMPGMTNGALPGRS